MDRKRALQKFSFLAREGGYWLAALLITVWTLQMIVRLWDAWWYFQEFSWALVWNMSNYDLKLLASIWPLTIIGLIGLTVIYYSLVEGVVESIETGWLTWRSKRYVRKQTTDRLAARHAKASKANGS